MVLLKPQGIKKTLRSIIKEITLATAVRAAPQGEGISLMRNSLGNLKKSNPQPLMGKLRGGKRPKHGCRG